MLGNREAQLTVLEGNIKVGEIGKELSRGQQVFFDAPHVPFDGKPAELHDVHLESPYQTSHYLLTHPRAQIEPFLQTIQRSTIQVGEKTFAVSPITRVTGRIMDFQVEEPMQADSTDSNITEYSLVDTAFMPAIYELRQRAAEAKKQNRPTHLTEFLEGNGDAYCVWHAGKLVGFLSTRQVSTVDYLEVIGTPEELGYDKANRCVDRQTYTYETGFTDLQSYDDPKTKELMKPFLEAIKNPDDLDMFTFIEVVALSILNPHLKGLQERINKNEALRIRVESFLTWLDNLHNPNSTLAHSILRAHFLVLETFEAEAARRAAKESIKPMPGEPSFSEQRAKIWYELAHNLSFNYRVKQLDVLHNANVDLYGQNKVQHPLRLEMRAHDDIDQYVASQVGEHLEKLQNAGKTHHNVHHLIRIIEANQGIQRAPEHNLTIRGLGGTGLRLAQDARPTAPVSKELVGGVGLSSEPEFSNYAVMLDSSYYPTEMVRSFQLMPGEKGVEGGLYRNTIPGVVTALQAVLPEIELGHDTGAATSKDLPTTLFLTSLKYGPNILTRFIMDKTKTAKGYDELRKAIHAGTISMRSIIEAPHEQTWSLISVVKADPNDPKSRREVRPIDTFRNGDAFVWATDSKGKVYLSKGKVPKQKPRTRRVGVINRRMKFSSTVPTPVYDNPQASNFNSHELEVIFAEGGVYARDARAGGKDSVSVQVPRQTKVVLKKTLRGMK